MNPYEDRKRRLGVKQGESDPRTVAAYAIVMLALVIVGIAAYFIFR